MRLPARTAEAGASCRQIDELLEGGKVGPMLLSFIKIAGHTAHRVDCCSHLLETRVALAHERGLAPLAGSSSGCMTAMPLYSTTIIPFALLPPRLSLGSPLSLRLVLPAARGNAWGARSVSCESCSATQPH